MMFEDILNQRIPFNQNYQLPEAHILSQDYQHFGANIDFIVLNEENKYDHFHHFNKQSTEEINPKSISMEISAKKIKKRVRKYISNNPNNKKGHWTFNQTLKYHCFLEINARYFIDSERRKIDKIFKAMANFIETRQPHQCRSHHQKIQKKWGSFTNILLSLRMQNFNGTKKICLIQTLQKMGLQDFQIFQDEDLRNEQQILKRILEQSNSAQNCQEFHRCEQNNQDSIVDLNGHKQNCMCLMMSEKYQDQLSI